MKKSIVRLLVLVLALVLSAAPTVGADDMEQADCLTGLVAELTEDGFAAVTGDGVIFVIVTEDTAMDTDGPLAVGDAVIAAYHGRTDRKTVTADSVTCHALTGTVIGAADDVEPGFLMRPDGAADAVRVNWGDVPAAALAEGQPVTVYFSGIMTRSIPAQVTALHVRGLTVEGTVGEAVEEGFLLTTAADETVVVTVSADTVVLASTEAGCAVRVAVGPAMTLSLPARYEAQVVLPGDTAK